MYNLPVVKWFFAAYSIHIRFHLSKLLVTDDILYHTAYSRSFSVLN